MFETLEQREENQLIEEYGSLSRYRLYQAFCQFGLLGALLWTVYDKVSPATPPEAPPVKVRGGKNPGPGS